MDPITRLSTIIFYEPIFNLLVVLYRFFSENLGISIILIALLSRLITLPISLRQTKMMSTNKEMQAKMDAIKQKYKNDKQKQQEEMSKVTAEYFPAQIAGCLPAVLQLILFVNLYNVITAIIKGAENFNVVAYPFVEKFAEGYQLHTSFLGIVDLKTTAASIGFSDLGVLPYLVLILLAAVTQFYSFKVSMPKISSDKDDAAKKEKAQKENPAEDFSSALQQSTKQTMFLFPVMIAFFSYSTPIGLSIYWIVQNSFVIIQTLLIQRFKRQSAERVI